ncbi:MAG: hypothetical protein GY796_09730, partial [Chloroflexi bacterium]|nr:hypothetical protein [Chloroflexota bacterium]
EYQARYNKKPHFDAIGWNIYGYNITSMKSFLIRRHQEAQNRGYNVPIWVVEYSGCLTFDSGASDRAVMKAITAWFDQKSWIDRYAWFSNRKSSSYQGEHNCILINNNNTLTTLGQIYKPF